MCIDIWIIPKNTLGKNQPTAQRRQGDNNFYKEARRIDRIFTMGGKGPTYRYMLKDLPNVSYTENQLKPARNPNALSLYPFVVLISS